MSYTSILVADDSLLRTITLNRPERRNAMTPAMQMELIAVLEETAASNVRALVLTGAGNAFCSGLDLSALQAMPNQSAPEHRADAERIARLFLSLHELPMPSIAAVNGAAVAGGAGLATICDFTLATPEAKFGFIEVRIGFVAALVSAFLMQQIGDKRVRDLLLSGRILAAEEALRLGLANEIVQPEELMERARALAVLLAANSPQAIRATKQLLAEQNKAWLDAAIVRAIEASVEARNRGDFREGIAAFLEKRKPEWGK